MTRIFEKVGYKTAVALGAFDGMHLGHIEVIKRVKGREGLESAVLTFAGDKPLPKLNFDTGYLLMTFEERAKAIENLGIDHLYAPYFDEIKNMEAEDFVEKILKEMLGARYIVCGYDFRFGRKARGNTELLSEMCRKDGIECDIVPEIRLDGDKISSSRIKALIREGDIPEANRLLGYEFSFTLPVRKGNQLGRTIGFPTINQKLPAYLVQPRLGVYASHIRIGDKIYAGITDIGVKPTVKDDKDVAVETYIKDFSGDLYGQDVKISLLYYIRGEKKFSGLDGLREQLKADLEQAGYH